MTPIADMDIVDRAGMGLQLRPKSSGLKYFAAAPRECRGAGVKTGMIILLAGALIGLSL